MDKNKPLKTQLLKTIGVISIFGIGLILTSSTLVQDDNSKLWIAPLEADKIINPVKGNPKAAAVGKKLYFKYCNVCHGDKGKGDGPAGLALTPRPTDHSSDITQNQSDGALYWKLTNGRPPMAPYKDALTDIQRWQLVNFIRTLKK